MKVGIDIIKTERIKNILEKNKSGFYRRIFTDSEISYIENKDFKTAAGLFAAKEAISKLLGSGIGDIAFKDIEIIHEEKGKPGVNIKGKLKEMLYLQGLNLIELSISHEEDYAIAYALGYKGDEEIIVPDELKGILRKRDSNTHKGDYGRVGIIGGSRGMTGAPYLASMAALRSGAGLVYNIVPDEIHDIMSIKHTEVIVKGYSNIEGCLNHIKGLDTIVLGPGMGVSEEKKELVKAILKNYKKTLVLDADGINLIDDNMVLYTREGETIITPHPGEMARLLGIDTKEIQGNRIKYSKYSSEKYNVISILKGHETICTYKGQIYLNSTGNPGMATAGSGDILSGIIAGFMAQSIEPFKASKLGVYVHGLAGDMAIQEKGEYGLIASDILECIPNAVKIVQNQR